MGWFLFAHKDDLVAAARRVDGDRCEVDRSRRINGCRPEDQRIQRTSQSGRGCGRRRRRRGCRTRSASSRARRSTSIEVPVHADNDRRTIVSLIRDDLQILHFLLKVRPILDVHIVTDHVVVGQSKVGELVNEMGRIAMEVGGNVVAECPRCDVVGDDEFGHHAHHVADRHERAEDPHHFAVQPWHQTMHLSRILAVETRRDVSTAARHVVQWQCVESALVDVRTPDGAAAARRNRVAGELDGEAFGQIGFVEEQLVEAIVVAGADGGAGAGWDTGVVASTTGNVGSARE